MTTGEPFYSNIQTSAHRLESKLNILDKKLDGLHKNIHWLKWISLVGTGFIITAASKYLLH